mgnify:CR=1 FL=1
MDLPPGQRETDGFPRFGVGGRVPRALAEHRLQVTGLGADLDLTLAELAALPRTEVVADFHCVSGWSARDQRWEGVRFRDLYHLVLRPHLGDDVAVTHVVLTGLDGYSSVAWLEDLLDPDVLLADRWAGRPLSRDHGAPLRLLSPAQYGFISTKHLARIGLHASEPRVRYHPTWSAHLGLQVVKPHPRARVWREERHRYLPAALVRPVYRRLIRHFKSVNRSSDTSGQLPTRSGWV